MPKWPDNQFTASFQHPVGFYLIHAIEILPWAAVEAFGCAGPAVNVFFDHFAKFR